MLRKGNNMQRMLLLVHLSLLGMFGYSQALYDPTWIYDGPGQLFDYNNVYEIRIEFYNTDYHNILTSKWFAEDKSRLPAKFWMDGVAFDSVGVRYKGNSTFYLADLVNNPKVPYNIDINHYVGGQKVRGYKKLKLANAYLDPTFSKEASASFIYRNYLPSPQAAMVKLYVQDAYLGAYINTESINKQFLQKHFREKNGAFMKCEPTAAFGTGDTFVPADLLWRGSDDSLLYYESYERKSDSLGWPEFIDMIDVLNNDPANIESVLNVDRTLWYFAVTTVLPNEDAYNTHVLHNYYMYQTGDGKWQMIPWDLSETYGGGLVAADGGTGIHYFRDPQYGFSPYAADRPLVYQLLMNPTYRMKFLHHVRTVMDEYYDADEIKAWVQDFQATGYSAIETDFNKVFTMSQLSQNVDNIVLWFFTQIGGITSTINERAPFLAAHPEVIKVPPVISDVTQNIENPTSSDIVYITATVSDATQVLLKVTNTNETYASDYIPVTMLDDGLGGDDVAGDGIYTAAIPFTTSNDHVKYYIEATNADAMELSPRRAEYFYYHYYVDQVLETPEEENLVQLKLYPNPSTDIVNISGIPENATLMVRNLNGQLIEERVSQSSKEIIDVNDYAPGTYFILVQDGNVSIKKKFVVK